MPETIRTSCPTCGTVEVPVAAVQLEVSVADLDSRNVLLFNCPQCGRQQRRRVAERATRLLSRSGVALVAPAQAVSETDTPEGRSSNA